MDTELVGAARTVTGSKHVVHTPEATVLLDCGLFQGRRRESIERNLSLGVEPRALDAVVLSHAHIDHSGALPILVKHGYEGPIYATSATRDLCAAMLIDAARIQASDATYVNNRIARDHADMEPVEPLYDEADVLRTLERMVTLPYRHRHTIARGVDVTFLDAGHVLGSAISLVDVREGASHRRLAYTGDLGRRRIPILKDPEIPPNVSALIMESTYGDRVHPPIEEMQDALADVLARVHARGGKVIIPSFALERAQEIVYALHALRRAGRMPNVPVFVDSPLTVKITDVFKLHPECYDAETRALLSGADSPFDFEGLAYVEQTDASKAIDQSQGSAVIIAASGMCEGGRVLHHLRAHVEDPRSCIVIVGYQAPHTLGRRIVERRPRVRIFGVERDLRAEVVVLEGFSAHADQRDLLAFAEAVRAAGPLGDVVLVHGEPPAQRALEAGLRERGFERVHAPAAGQRIRV